MIFAPGSTYKLVLIDVEFHSATPEEQPEVVRRAARVPRQIGRLTLLHRLGLDAYCRATRQSCTLWRNGEIASRYSALPLDINHGDYLRIVVPAGDHVASHIGTRCVASACQQGVALSEICDRHALFVLGWYDTIIGQPLVTLRLDGDGISLLQQHTGTPPLPVSRWFLLKSSLCRINKTVPTDHFETDFSATTRSFADSALPTLPGGIEQRPGIDEQPEHIQNLLGQLEQDGAIEVEEEGQVLYVNTWFLNYPEHERCLEYRKVRIAGDFEHWNQQFTRAWRERIEPGIPVHFYLVSPTASDIKNATYGSATCHSYAACTRWGTCGSHHASWFSWWQQRFSAQCCFPSSQSPAKFMSLLRPTRLTTASLKFLNCSAWLGMVMFNYKVSMALLSTMVFPSWSYSKMWHTCELMLGMQNTTKLTWCRVERLCGALNDLRHDIPDQQIPALRFWTHMHWIFSLTSHILDSWASLCKNSLTFGNIVHLQGKPLNHLFKLRCGLLIMQEDISIVDCLDLWVCQRTMAHGKRL